MSDKKEIGKIEVFQCHKCNGETDHRLVHSEEKQGKFSLDSDYEFQQSGRWWITNEAFVCVGCHEMCIRRTSDHSESDYPDQDFFPPRPGEEPRTAPKWVHQLPDGMEEYHKGLKTGVRIEAAQVTTRDRLEPLIGLLSVVALQLLWVRDAARDPALADEPADRFVDPILVALAARSPTGVKARGPVVTVAEFYHMVARLGGYLGNIRKKPPGWQTLWHGWTRLNLMAQGVRAAEDICNL